MSQEPSNGRSPSTRWEFRRVKVTQRPEGPSSASSKSASSQSAWNPRDALTVTLRYRGGAEAWWEIKGRGKTIRVPGHRAIHDVMRQMMNHPSLE